MDKKVRKISKEKVMSIVKSLMDGEFLFRIHIDKVFKYVVSGFVIMMMIVFIHYWTDKALSMEKNAEEELSIAKSKYDRAFCEYMGLIRESNIKDLARKNGLSLDTPKQPAKVIK